MSQRAMLGVDNKPLTTINNAIPTTPSYKDAPMTQLLCNNKPPLTSVRLSLGRRFIRGLLFASAFCSAQVMAQPIVERIEAEAAVSVIGSHAIRNNNGGFSGTGYRDYSGEGAVEWNATIGVDSDVALRLRPCRSMPLAIGDAGVNKPTSYR